MKLSFSKNFEKKFERYDKKLQAKIYTAIVNIPNGDIKKLVGNEIPPIYRLRVSKYRVLFYMNKEEIKILKIDSRGDIYK